jgi:hypothetical protein
LLATPSQDGDDLERGQSGAQRLGNLKAVGSGQPDIQENEVRPHAARDEERRVAVSGDVYIVSQQCNQPR